MNMSLLSVPWSDLIIGLSCLALVGMAISCGGAASAPGPGPSGPITLAPPDTADAEQQWSRAWIDAAVGTGKAQVVEVECLSQEWGAMHWNESLDHQGLCLGGQKHDRGLATHANSEIRVRVPQGARLLNILAGVDDNDKTRSLEAAKIAFSVQVAGKTVWSCPPRGAGDGPVLVGVDLGGATEFSLLAKSAGESIRFAHADWVEPVVTLADGTKVDLSRPPVGMGVPSGPPFSFRYGGKPSAELLPTWQVTRSSQDEPDGVRLHRTVYKDPQTRLECVMDLRQYPDFPAAKWVIHFRNGGQSDTPILEDIQALDAAWCTSSKAALTYSKGSSAKIDDFLPATVRLPQLGLEEKPLTFGCQGGRPTTLYLPYFNLADGRSGVMIGIGWTGQWAAAFDQDVNHRTHVRAGMEKTHLVLHPGEEIRTPSVLTIFWQGEPIRGHNLLRQFILHHNSPRIDGRIVQAPEAVGSWGGQFSKVQIEDIKRTTAAGLAFDIFWIDAGWFGDAHGQFLHELTGHWYRQAGNWDIDRSIHPDGFLEVSKAVRDAGLGLLLWVEPERAIWGSKVTKEHPDWFYPLGERKEGQSVLLNLGNPKARQWATDLVSGLVKDLRLAWYRQDFNMDCLEQWRANDTPDRQGMSEIRHVEGLYAFWDELRARHPCLMIDNCASGGRRLDLEMMARSLPLWRTDYHCPGMEGDPVGGQVHTMGLSYWLPLHGTAAAAGPMDTYAFRSNMTAAIGFGAPADVLTNAPVRQWCQTMLAQHKQARVFFYGDYYPLTKTSAQGDTWAAYQLHRRDLQQGMLMLIRRTDSPFSAAQFQLGGLDASGEYEFTDADTGKKVAFSGKELMAGTTWHVDAPRTARLIFYRKVR